VAELAHHLRGRQDVRSDTVIVVGWSAGAATALAASALEEPVFKGVIAFAAGAGANPKTPGVPCMPDALVHAFAHYGQTSHVPTLWINAENDRSFGPEHTRAWFAAFTGHGGTGEQVMLPPRGANGHFFFLYGISEWGPLVRNFLAKHDLLPQEAPAPR
jgi:dienelactone hydrolase